MRINTDILMSKISNISEQINSLTGRQIQSEEVNDEHALLESVRGAYQEWNNAQRYFENVTDPDLVDYAIYQIEASKLRYNYLLKQAKTKGIRLEEV
jgi:hypothetical protein